MREILLVLARYGISSDKVELWGTGKPLREFLWSEEMADASVYIMEHVDFKDTYSQGDTDIRDCHINIGTGKEISIATLADLIVRTTGYRGKVEFNYTKPDGYRGWREKNVLLVSKHCYKINKGIKEFIV